MNSLSSAKLLTTLSYYCCLEYCWIFGQQIAKRQELIKSIRGDNTLNVGMAVKTRSVYTHTTAICDRPREKVPKVGKIDFEI